MIRFHPVLHQFNHGSHSFLGCVLFNFKKLVTDYMIVKWLFVPNRELFKMVPDIFETLSNRK